MLRAGLVLDGDLFSLGGAKLLAKGATLNQAHVRMLRRQHRQGVLLEGVRRPNRSPDASSVSVRRVAVDEHREEEDEVRRLRRARARRAREADAYAAERARRWDRLARRVAPTPEGLANVSGVEWPRLDGLRAFRAERVRRLCDVYDAAFDHADADVEVLFELADELIDLMAEWPGGFGSIGLHDVPEHVELAERGYRVGALGVAIAGRLGWSRQDTEHAAIAGFLCDLGMMLVPNEARAAARPLDEFEANRVFRHPMFSVMLMDSVRGVPEPVRLAAYQHHERENGLGYPTGVRGERIGDLARVVAVADAMAGGVTPRPWRVDRRAHDTVAEIVRLANEGVYHRRTVRALARAVGIFPVGSWVLLSSGDTARVIASDEERLERPVVAIDGRDTAGHRLALARGTVRVLRAVDPPSRRAVVRPVGDARETVAIAA